MSVDSVCLENKSKLDMTGRLKSAGGRPPSRRVACGGLLGKLSGEFEKLDSGGGVSAIQKVTQKSPTHPSRGALSEIVVYAVAMQSQVNRVKLVDLNADSTRVTIPVSDRGGGITR
jgi:hypothetical protein